MKFTSEDLMKAMGLQVGDRIKCAINEYTIVKINDEVLYQREGNGYSLVNLVGREIEILPRPKRVGDLKCSDDDTSNCRKCPLFVLCHASREYDNKRLYDVLDNWLKSSKDQEIYDLLKARLDKEVEENVD